MSTATGQTGKDRRGEGVTGPPPHPAKGRRQKPPKELGGEMLCPYEGDANL